MDLGTHILRSLLIELDISNVSTPGGAIDITTGGDLTATTSASPTVDHTGQDDTTQSKKLTRRHYCAMKEHTEQEVIELLEDWKSTAIKTAGGAAVGGAVAGGGFYMMKKKIYNNEMKRFKSEKEDCQDDDCRDWVNEKIQRVKDKMARLKKQSLKVAAGGAVTGAAVVNHKAVMGLINKGASPHGEPKLLFRK